MSEAAFVAGARARKPVLHSFRLRLTVWYLSFFSLLFGAFSFFLYGVLSKGLRARLDGGLRSEAAIAAGLFQDEMEEVKGDTRRAGVQMLSEMRLNGSMVAIFQGSQLVASSGDIPSSELERALLRAGDAPSGLADVPGWSRKGARAAAHDLDLGGRRFRFVALESLDSIDGELQLVRHVLFLTLPLLIGLAGIGGYLLATGGLRPLSAMAQQARLISGSNLEARLEIGDAADELAVLAESFNELLSRLDQSFATMRRFVADASHELRTPVAVIRGEADVALAQERPASDYRQALAIVLDESKRLSGLVDDLLNLARADAGHVKLQIEEFYWNDLLAECCRSLEARARTRTIALECCCGEDIPFRGDEELLRRLVVNLLDNAIRYTPPGGRVSASLEADGRELRIRIADTGVGIAPEAALHVFERFYRVDRARSRQAVDDAGFGLGLSIVKWIAESHHGAVELVSQPGAGTTFTVTLPR